MSVVCALVWASPARADVPLRMPWACGESRVMTQGNQLGSHRGKGAYAWDFRMGVGERVRAMASGRVRRVRGDSRRGGCDPRLAEAANYVIVAHDDGAEALYLHLEADSLEVAQGQRVEAGQPLGRVGLSGWVCGAHLHVQLQQPCASWWCDSTPSRFVEGEPSHGEAIVSQNCAATAAQALARPPAPERGASAWSASPAPAPHQEAATVGQTPSCASAPGRAPAAGWGVCAWLVASAWMRRRGMRSRRQARSSCIW